MNNNNNNELAMGIGIMAVVAIVIMIAGIIIALLAVASFVFSQWLHIHRYEGSKPVWWLAGATMIIALPCISSASEQLQLMNYYLDRNDDRSFGALFSALFSIVFIAAPTAGYWVYRLMKPISHFRIATIDQFRAQYQQGDLTRAERDTYIKEIIAMGDEALEKQVAHARRKPKAAPITVDNTAPVGPAPANNTASPINHGSNPRGAFDIPQQRADG